MRNQHHPTGDGLCIVQAARAGEKASTACSLRLQLLGLERFVHFPELSPLHW